MQFAQFMTDQEAERVHQASMETLETVGILVRNPEAREIFAKHGCRVDNQTAKVKLPPDIVEKYRQGFVSSFTFQGRDERFDRRIPDDSPAVVTASSAPDIVDPESGMERRANSSDIAKIAYLINELPGYDIFSISTFADDAPADQVALSRFYPALKNCLKPVRGNVPSKKELLQVLELGAIVAGGREAYKERPLITHHCCPMISPLTMDIESTGILIYLAQEGLPVYGTVSPNAGMTGPMTLMGTLTLGNAEFLALSMLLQMIRPQAPMIYAVLSTVADMRAGRYAPGAIETGILQMAHSQMARFYNVPAGGYVGLTNAHSNDAQSGFETGMDNTAALLAGTDMLNMGGLLSSLMAFDFAKAVIDNEIALMLKRIRRGLEFSEENISFDLLAKIGPGGTFMDQKHTLNHMRSTAVLPKVATRDLRSSWEAKGRPDAKTRAMEEAVKIFSRGEPAGFEQEIEAEIRTRFAGLVTGEAPRQKAKVRPGR